MSYPLTRPSFALPARRSRRSFAHERAAALISRYPDLGKQELAHLVGLFPRLSALDLSLMMADDELCPKLEAFCATHRSALSPSFGDLAVIGAILSLPIMMLLAAMLSRSVM